MSISLLNLLRKSYCLQSNLLLHIERSFNSCSFRKSVPQLRKFDLKKLMAFQSYLICSYLLRKKRYILILKVFLANQNLTR